MNWSCSPAKASWMSRNFEKAAGINCGIRADRIMQIESGAREAPWDAPGNAPGVPGGFLGERVGWETPACYKSLQCPPSSLTGPGRNCCVVTQTCSPMPLGFERHVPVAMILSFPVIAFPKIPHSLEQLPPFETPRASFIPAQGNALGSWPQRPSGALKARLILAWHEAGRWPAAAKRAMNPGRCPGLL